MAHGHRHNAQHHAFAASMLFGPALHRSWLCVQPVAAVGSSDRHVPLLLRQSLERPLNIAPRISSVPGQCLQSFTTRSPVLQNLHHRLICRRSSATVLHHSFGLLKSWVTLLTFLPVTSGLLVTLGSLHGIFSSQTLTMGLLGLKMHAATLISLSGCTCRLSAKMACIARGSVPHD